MPHKIMLNPTAGEFRMPGSVQLKPGEAFYSEHHRESQFRKSLLSQKYWRDHAARRAPIVVVLPGGDEWCIDQMARANGECYGDGWDVTGTIEGGNLTVSPSINMPPTYHGWIQNGFVSDDCEGRQYDENNRLKQ